MRRWQWHEKNESLVRVPETPSTRHGGRARGASRDSSSSSNAPLTITQRSDGTRPRHAVDAKMGTPVLVGARGRESVSQRRLVRAAVDLGLELRRDRVERLLEVRIITTTVRLLQPLPG